MTETFPPEVNGVAMTLGRVTQGLAVRGWEVEVVRPRQKDEVEGRQDRGAPVRSWLVPGVPIPFYRSLRMGLPWIGTLVRHWRERAPSVVHIATEGPLGLAALFAARQLQLPVTSSFHTNFHQYGGHYGLQHGRVLALRYLRWFHNLTACTLVPTEEMRRNLAEAGFERLGVMARGVDTTLFDPRRRSEELRGSWGAGPDVPVLLHVGRMAAEKNMHLAVEAFDVFKKQIPAARMVFVGDGPERVALQKRRPDFVFAGMRRGEDLAAHYASADVFVFPSVTETFGNVVTEAMASGLVTLAYDYAAAQAYLREPGAGVVASFGDEASFLAAAHALALQRDSWNSMRRVARQRAEAITWDAVVDQFAIDLQEAIGGARPRAGAAVAARRSAP